MLSPVWEIATSTLYEFLVMNRGVSAYIYCALATLMSMLPVVQNGTTMCSWTQKYLVILAFDREFEDH